MTTKAYLTIGTISPRSRSSSSSTSSTSSATTIGNLTLHLHSNIVPRTVRNFLELLTRTKPNGYIGSSFHRLIPGFMIQGGDFTAGDGTGGRSIYNNDGMFDDENFEENHTKRGVLSMANSGPNTNGSQFFITFKRCPHLDGKHVVFGCVDLEDDEGRELLQRLEEMKVTRGSGNVPKADIVITDGGLIEDPKNNKEGKEVQAVHKEIIDDDEIDLEDEDHQGAVEQQQEQDQQVQQEQKVEAIHDETTTTDNNTKTTKKKRLQDRFRKLKLKMNQSTRLNHAEVVREGERLGSEDAIKRQAKHISKEKKARVQAEWKSVHSKALRVSSNADDGDNDNDVDAKYMVQPANESLRKVQKDAEKEERNRFGVNDYYNPEGQLRNYERSLRSLRPGHTYTTYTNNPNTTNGSEKDEQRHLKKCHQNERDGARRLASELERRANKAAKRKLNREEMNFDGADIGHINQRNKRFNEKINRNYDRHTVEIKQNLERGTAL